MSRIRCYKPEFWSSERLARDCTRDQRLFYLGLFTEADDEGRFLALPRKLLGSIFPYDEDLTELWVRDSLSLFVSTGRIVLYRAGGPTGTQYGQLVNFHKHQKINRPTPSRIPAPPAESIGISESLTEELTESLKQKTPQEVGSRKQEVGSRITPPTPSPGEGHSQEIADVGHEPTSDRGEQPGPEDLRVATPDQQRASEGEESPSPGVASGSDRAASQGGGTAGGGDPVVKPEQPPAADPIPWDAMRERWNRMAGTDRCPLVATARIWDKSAQRQFGARLKEYGGDPLALWEEVCSGMEWSDFTSGRNPWLGDGKKWEPKRSIAWAVSPKQFAKITNREHPRDGYWSPPQERREAERRIVRASDDDHPPRLEGEALEEAIRKGKEAGLQERARLALEKAKRHADTTHHPPLTQSETRQMGMAVAAKARQWAKENGW